MLIPQLGYGGAESAFLRLTKFLALHADVTIALMARDYGGGNYSTEGGQTDLPVVLLDDGRISKPSVAAKAMRWWRMLRRLKRLKREHDVSISFLSGMNLLNAIASPRIRTVVSERGSKLHHTNISKISKFLWLKFLDPLTYRLASSIVVVSKGYATEVATIAGKSAQSKVIAIEGPVDARALMKAADGTPDPDISRFCTGSTAVFCGRLDHGKGIDLLAHTFADIRKSVPKVRFLIIGDGPLLETLKELFRDSGLTITTVGDPSADIFMAGYRSSPSRHYKLAQVFLFPSLHEGLGNALIEAVASSIPVLAADCPWGPRSILAGPTDILPFPERVTTPLQLEHGTLMPLPTDSKSLEAWAGEIIKALQTKVIPRSSEATRQAISRFDIETAGPEWMQVIRNVAARAGRDVE
tara:strand:+ start:7718 stop:8953 length:1236 start_codon:yes stop_codon:yes gene_type:complete